MRGRVVEAGRDNVIGVLKSDALHDQRFHRVAGVRHRYELCDNAFDYLCLIGVHRVGGRTIVAVSRNKTSHRPKDREAKENLRKPLLHPWWRLPENTEMDQRGHRQTDNDEDKTERRERPLPKPVWVMSKTVVYSTGRCLTKTRSATADDSKAGLKLVCVRHPKVGLYAVKRFAASLG